MLRDVYHTGFTVARLERSLAFYRNLLGLEVVATRTAQEPYIQRLVGAPGATLRIAYLRVPGQTHLLELIEYVNVERTPIAGQPRDPGVGHVCFFVANLAELFGRLRAAGVQTQSEPVVATAGRNAGA